MREQKYLVLDGYDLADAIRDYLEKQGYEIQNPDENIEIAIDHDGDVSITLEVEREL